MGKPLVKKNASKTCINIEREEKNRLVNAVLFFFARVLSQISAALFLHRESLLSHACDPSLPLWSGSMAGAGAGPDLHSFG